MPILDIKEVFRSNIRPYLTIIKDSLNVTISDEEALLDWTYVGVEPLNYIKFVDTSMIPTEQELLDSMSGETSVIGYRVFGDILMWDNLFDTFTTNSFIDTNITEFKLQCKTIESNVIPTNNQVKVIDLPRLEFLGSQNFIHLNSIESISMPNIITLGGFNIDSSNNFGIFTNISGRTINLTLPRLILDTGGISALTNTKLTDLPPCLEQLSSQNTVTITVVNNNYDYFIFNTATDTIPEIEIENLFTNPITGLRLLDNLVLIDKTTTNTFINNAFGTGGQLFTNNVQVVNVSMSEISSNCFQGSTLQKLYGDNVTVVNDSAFKGSGLWWCYLPSCTQLGTDNDPTTDDDIFGLVQNSLSLPNDFTLTIDSVQLTNNSGGEDENIVSLRDRIENVLGKILNLIGL